MDGMQQSQTEAWIVGPLEIRRNSSSFFIRHDGKVAGASLAIVRLLVFFHNNPHRHLTRSEIVHGLLPETKIDNNSVSNLVSRTRKILEEVSFALSTRLATSKKFYSWVPRVGDPKGKLNPPTKFVAIGDETEDDADEPDEDLDDFSELEPCNPRDIVLTLQPIPSYRLNCVFPTSTRGIVIRVKKYVSKAGKKETWVSIYAGKMKSNGSLLTFSAPRHWLQKV